MLTKFSRWEPTFDINPNCMHTRPRNWTQVASLGGEIANHYTRGAGWSSNSINQKKPLKWDCQQIGKDYYACIIY